MAAATQVKTDEKPVDVLPEPDDDVAESAVVTDGDAAAEAESGDQPVRSPRQEKADRLAEATRLYREKRDRENQEFVEKQGGQEPAAEVVEEPAVAEPEAQPVSAAPAAKASPAVLGDDDEIELVVYGNKVTKKVKDIRADAQKLMAADQKFDEAKRLLEEAKAIRNAPARRDDDVEPEHQPVRSGQRANSDRTAENQPGDDLDDTALDSIVERIQVGDKDEGRAAIADLAKLIMNGNTSRLDETKVRDIIRQDSVISETKREIDTALAKFSTAFPTIVSDDDLVDVALRRVQNEIRSDLRSTGMSDEELSKITDPGELARKHGEVRRKGANVRTYDALLTDVGTHLSNKFGAAAKPQSVTPSPNPAPSAKPVAQQRVEMKRAAAPQPRAAGARVPAQQAPKPKTAQEIIAETRRARRFS